ncbi:hypothetical protein CLV93_107131 [Prolixibacter denitrificans]|uniref:Uncharacterized protein n=1 Tax=Prolixibacter denitrificans TaxID=1541063 RepID=A0A2P8CAN0_9BACT|nr:hypothetical protein CLV93_107131 [Prolixibacter denitrificans]
MGDFDFKQQAREEESPLFVGSSLFVNSICDQTVAQIRKSISPPFQLSVFRKPGELVFLQDDYRS